MAWEYSDNEFIKLYRKLINWEWYSDTPTRSVFIHCLLRANWKPTKWHGIQIDRGELIETNETIANALGLTVKQVRTAFKHLEGSESITYRKAGKYRIIKVVKYIDYQGDGTKRASTMALHGHLKGTQKAADIISIECKEVEEYLESPAPETDNEDEGVITLDEAMAIDWRNISE